MTRILLIGMIALALAVGGQALAALPAPTGDLTEMYADPATIIGTDPVDDEPLNPDGQPTGFNLRAVLARWHDGRNALEIGLDCVKPAWDADGDGSWLTSSWPWNPPWVSIPDEMDDIPVGEWPYAWWQEDYLVMVYLGGRAVATIHLRQEWLGWPHYTVAVWTTDKRRWTWWSARWAGYPPLDAPQDDIQLLIWGLRAKLGTELDLPLKIRVRASAGNLYWLVYEHEDWATLQSS
jgi:hypothetical protein